MAATNSDGLINCLLQPGLFRNQPPKSLRLNSIQLIKSCCTRTVPAAKTKSIGLQADAPVVMVFASHLNNFIVTRQILPFIGTTPSGQILYDTKLSFTYRDFAKTHANPDTDGNSLNRRAVMCQAQLSRTNIEDLKLLKSMIFTVIKTTSVRYMFIKQNCLTMKKSIIVCALICTTLLSNGQLSIGVSAGSNLSTMSIYLRDLTTFRINPIFGYNVNLIAQYKLNPSLALWSGLSINQKGFNQHIKYYYSPRVDSTADMISRLTYLELPIYLIFNTNLNKTSLFYGIGPYLSYGLQGKITTEITGRTNESITDNMKWDKSYDYIKSDLVKSYGYTNLKRFDFGIGTILGIKVKNFMLTASYKYGLNNLLWEYSQDEKMSNSSLSISIGYYFDKILAPRQL